MALWLIRPSARRGDPRWLDHRIWREVIVRAPSAAFARAVAAGLERNPEAPPTGNESLSFKSAFEDEKLYHVKRLSERKAEMQGRTKGPNEVVRACELDVTARR